jgi:DNA-binding response OmpR family regulator
MMPALNGFQTCRRLKTTPETSKVPVIILTSKDQPTDEFWAREVGADAFMHKPADIPALLALLTRLTESS